MEFLRWLWGQIHGSFYCLLILVGIFCGIKIFITGCVAIGNFAYYCYVPEIETQTVWSGSFGDYIQANADVPQNFKASLRGEVFCDPGSVEEDFCRYIFYPEMTPKWWFNLPKDKPPKKEIRFRMPAQILYVRIKPEADVAGLVTAELEKLADECRSNRRYLCSLGIKTPWFVY